MAETRRTEQTPLPDVPTVEPERELPEANLRANPRLNETAEAIGGALGSAARQVQNVRERFTVIPGGAQGGPSTTERIKETAQEKVEELKERAGSALEQARMQAADKLQEARLKGSRLADQAQKSASERLRLVRARANRLIEERPLQVLMGICGAAFVLGFFLRLGRTKRG